MCEANAGNARSGWVYTLQLRLEDATDELDALLFDEDGDAFFQVMLTGCGISSDHPNHDRTYESISN